MRRFFAEMTEVTDGHHDAAAEMMMPYAIDEDASGEGMLPICHALCESQAAAGRGLRGCRFGNVARVKRSEHRELAWLDFVLRLLWIAAREDKSWGRGLRRRRRLGEGRDELLNRFA